VVPVEPQVFELLTYLIANNQRVVSKDELLAAVWEGRIVSESAMTTRVNAARCAVGDNGYEQRLIKTVRRKGFRFIAPVREIDALHPPRRVAAQPALNKPSLAVLPFRSLARDPAERCFSANLIEQLTSLLCKYPWVSVSARSGALNTGHNFLPTHVQYLLGGSVRKSASTVRVAAHLIDVSSDTYLWADHFDRDYDETFEAQDNLAEKLVGEIHDAHASARSCPPAFAPSPSAIAASPRRLRQMRRRAPTRRTARLMQSLWSSRLKLAQG
jgi:adenylate cyclase